MIIYKGEQPFIFVHIPKTAGSTIRYTLRNILNNKDYVEFYYLDGDVDKSHICLYYLEKFYPEYDPHTPIITSVRNPYDRIYSAYKYSKDFYAKEEIFKKSFNDFVKTILPGLVESQIKLFHEGKIQKNVGIHFMPEYIFLLDKDMKFHNDYIIKQENFNAEYMNILNKFGIKINGGHIVHKLCSQCAPSKEGDYLKYYDKDMIDIIDRLYYTDFKTFGYKMMSGFVQEPPVDFDPVSYIANHPDLHIFNTTIEAITHWRKYGHKENRKHTRTIPLSFHWENYLKLNPDLVGLKTEIDAVKHWVSFGRNNNRPY